MVDIQANHIDFIINMTNLWKIPRLRCQLIHENKRIKYGIFEQERLSYQSLESTRTRL
jgi:hypothetical protein